MNEDKKIKILNEQIKKAFSDRKDIDKMISEYKSEMADLFSVKLGIYVGRSYIVTYDKSKYQCDKSIKIEISRYYCTDSGVFCVVGVDENEVEWWCYPGVDCKFSNCEEEIDEYVFDYFDPGCYGCYEESWNEND